MTIKIDSYNFNEEVLGSSKPVVLDFWAQWCGPCKMLSPILDEIAEERPDVKICKINIDEEPELAREYGIVSIPTLLFISEGEEVSRSIGVIPKDQILSML